MSHVVRNPVVVDLAPRLLNLSTVSNSKQSTMIGCLRTHARKQPIIVLYFEFENELKFYNLGARFKRKKYLHVCILCYANVTRMDLRVCLYLLT